MIRKVKSKHIFDSSKTSNNGKNRGKYEQILHLIRQ